jgi:hypothetical protein
VARDEVSAGETKSTSTLYYPGVRDRGSAKVISIEAGKYASNIEIRIPSGEVRHKLSGHLVFSDGQPVAGAGVTFVSTGSGYSESASTHDDGSFRFTVAAGIDGEIGARITIMEPTLRSCPGFQVEPLKRGLLRFMDAVPVPVSTDSDRENLTLKLSSPSCKSWKGYPSRKE